jgi:hypothetical protein
MRAAASLWPCRSQVLVSPCPRQGYPHAHLGSSVLKDGVTQSGKGSERLRVLTALKSDPRHRRGSHRVMGLARDARLLATRLATQIVSSTPSQGAPGGRSVENSRSSTRTG